MMDIQFRSRSIATIHFKADGQVSATRGFDIVILRLPFRIELEIEPNGSTWLADGNETELFGVEAGGAERLLAFGDVRTALESRTHRYDQDVFIDFRY